MDNIIIYFLVVNGVAVALVHHNQKILIDAHRSQKRDFRSSSANPVLLKIQFML